MSSDSQGIGRGRRRRGSLLRQAGSGEAVAAGPGLSPAEWAAALDADAIFAGAGRVLAEAGLAVELPPGLRERAAAAGLQTTADRVRFPAEAMQALLATTPARFRHLSPIGDRDLEIGAGQVLLGPPPAARWMWSGRKERFALGPAQVREACDVAAALGLAYDGCGLATSSSSQDRAARLEPIAASSRPLIAMLGGGVSAAALIGAVDADRPEGGLEKGGPCCRLLAILPLDTSLTLGNDGLADLAKLAEAGVGIVVAPMLVIGATTPASAIGALVRLAAETMAVTALAQMMRPGVPVGMGVQVAQASMRNGVPLAATAEVMKTVAGARILARRLGVPSLALGPATAAKGFDAQAGTETAAWLSVALAHDVVLGLGGLELDEGLSLEKLVLDADLANALFAPAGSADADGAAAAVMAAGAGGLHIGEPATREAARRAPPARLADDWVIESWRAAGSPDAADRAQVVLADILMARASAAGPPPPAGEAAMEPAPRRTLMDVAAAAYSQAMRDAFGFKA